MGLLDELRKIAQPYEDEDDYFEESDKPVQGYTVRPRAVPATGAEKEFEDKFGAAPAAAPINDDETDDDEEEEMSGGLFGNLGKRVRRQQTVSREQSFSSPRDNQVIVFSPKSFDDAGELVSHLNKKHSLVLTLEGIPTETARRLLDFISGVAFAMHGNITPVSSKTYLIAPEGSDLINTDSLGK